MISNRNVQLTGLQRGCACCYNRIIEWGCCEDALGRKRGRSQSAETEKGKLLFPEVAHIQCTRYSLTVSAWVHYLLYIQYMRSCYEAQLCSTQSATYRGRWCWVETVLIETDSSWLGGLLWSFELPTRYCYHPHPKNDWSCRLSLVIGLGSLSQHENEEYWDNCCCLRIQYIVWDIEW